MKITPDFNCLIENIDVTLYELQEDVEMLSRIYDYEANHALTDQQQFLTDYLAIRLTRNIIVSLDCILDEPSDSSGINIKKLLNSYQSLAISTPKNEQEIINKNYAQFEQCYNKIRNSEKRKELKKARDKLFAHMDFKFIKNSKFKSITIDNFDASLLIEQSIYLFNGVCTAISYNTKTNPRLPGLASPRIDDIVFDKIIDSLK